MLRGKALLKILSICNQQDSITPIDVRLVPTQFKSNEELCLKDQLIAAVKKECDKNWKYMNWEIKYYEKLCRTMHKSKVTSP